MNHGQRTWMNISPRKALPRISVELGDLRMWLVKLVATLLTICEVFGVVNRRKEISEGGIMTSSKVQSAVNADPSSPNVFTISTALIAKDWLLG